MDPISVTASVIAIAQAVASVQKALRFLRSLRYIPTEIQQLFDEVETVLEVTQQVKNVLKALEALDTEYFSATVRRISGVQLQDALASVKVQVKRLEEATKELKCICSRFLPKTSSAGPSQTLASQTANHKQTGRKRDAIRQTATWLQERSKIEPIRTKLRTARETLSTILTIILLVRQATLEPQLWHKIQTTMTGVAEIKSIFLLMDARLMRIEHALLNPEARDLAMSALSAMQPTTAISDEPTTAGSLNSLLVRQAGLIDPPGQPKEESFQRQNIEDSLYFIRTVIQNEGRMSSIFWSSHPKSSTLPISQPRPCNIESCAGPNKSINVLYMFPRWVVHWASCMATSLTRVGCDLHLQLPRILHPDVEEKFTSFESPVDVDWLKHAISQKLISPNSVLKDGLNLIGHSLISWDRGGDYKVTEFLIEQGFSVTTGKGNIGDFIRILIYLQFSCNLRSIPSSLLRIVRFIDNAAPSNGNTLFYDILMGIEQMSFSDAVRVAPWGINDMGCVGETAMHIAIQNGFVDDLKAILSAPESNVDVLARSDGQSPLHYAGRYNRLAMAKILLNAGANVNIPSRTGTPIFHSLESTEITELFLSRGANITADTSDGLSNPLLVWSAKNWIARESRKAVTHSLDLLFSAGLDLEMKNQLGQTSFTLAVSRGHRFIAEWLLGHEVEVNNLDHSGQSILHYAATRPRLDMMRSIPHTKLQGLDPDAQDKDGNTPMDLFYGLNDLDFCRNWRDIDVTEYAYRFETLLETTRAVNRAAELGVEYMEGMYGRIEELYSDDGDQEDGEDKDTGIF